MSVVRKDVKSEYAPLPSREPTRDFGNLESIFLSDFQSLEEAEKHGLPASAKIRTSSPALANSPMLKNRIRTVSASVEAVEKLSADTESVSIEIRDRLFADSDLKRFALLGAYTAVQTTKVVLCAYSLNESDFTKPLGVVEIDTGNIRFDSLHNPPWPEILAENQNLIVKKYATTVEKVQRHSSQKYPRLLDRLRFLPWSNYETKFWLKVWQKLPTKLARGSYLIAYDNSLLRDTVLHLARRGYALHKIEPGFQQNIAIDAELFERVAAAAMPPFRRFLEDRFSQPIVDALSRVFRSRLSKACNELRSSYEMWREELSSIQGKKPKGLLSNMLAGPHGIGLHHACQDFKIPVFSFQHGHSRELNRVLRYYGAVLEEAASEVMYCYSPKGAQATDANPFSIATAKAVGMPKDYVDCYSRGRQQKASAPSILYVSTGALSGTRLGPISSTWDDVRKTKHEIGLIDNVFARLPYQVLYKPYPSTVYLDPSPIQEHTEKTGNVTYYQDNFDLRYILSQSSVIVTSRSTSTMGWCLAPDVPLVFIDLPNQIPPQKEFLEHLRKSVFYFDGAAPDLEQRLVEFLSRPLTVIEEEWRAMSGYREIMLDEFFGSRDGNAGRNAAAHILKFEAPSPSASFGGDTK